MNLSNSRSVQAFLCLAVIFFSGRLPAQPACAAPPSGLVGWWRAEGNGIDQGGNNGTLVGNTTFGPGQVGQAFVFDGSGDGVSLSNRPSLQLQNFTIEGWIKRSSTNKVSLDFNGGEFFSFGFGGFVFGLKDDGHPFLSRVGISETVSTQAVTDLVFHHVAVAKNGTNVIFYVDGSADVAPPLSDTFTFGGPPAIGARGDNFQNSFLGAIDEISMYNRQLSGGEIQSIYNSGALGKCVPAPANCAAAPLGLISWWRGEGNFVDEIGGNNGTNSGVIFGAGQVGQAFTMNGNGSAVQLGNPANLRVQDFTIEAWIRRANTSVVSLNGNGNGHIFGYDNGGYGLYLSPSGEPTLTKTVFNNVGSGVNITDTNFHHVAVTKSGSSVVFYVDGVAHAVGPYNPGFTFSASAYIGGLANNYTFFGTIDEVSFYNRALSGSEVQAIYGGGSSGKCGSTIGPSITSQPANQTVHVGETAIFSVGVSGTPPLSYQWRYNDTNIDGATSASLTLTNLQIANSGNYSVLVSNSAGSVLSSNALLTVNPLPPCSSPPTGLISWWRGEGNFLDQMGTDNGTGSGGIAFGSGRVGQAFVANGNGSAVQLGNPANLQAQDFTIETWIRRASTAVVSLNGNGNGHIFGYDNGGYGLYLSPGGEPTLTKTVFNAVGAGINITDTNFHHVAVTKSGSTVVFYVDGTAHSAPAYDPGFTFSASAYIGGLGNNYTFLGTIDEVSFYNRALSTAEVQAIYNADAAGKCGSGIAPSITTQPGALTLYVGDTATFSVGVSGTPPLSYQWLFNGTNLDGATSASLILNNVQLSNAGNYSVLVTNSVNSVLSSNAFLTVNPLPPCTNSPAGLIGWWKGEGNFLDQLGSDNGTGSGSVTFASGRVGQGFVMNGSGSVVQLGNPANLQIQDFTIEAWIRRVSTSAVSLNGNGNGHIFGYDNGGYGLYLSPSGEPTLTRTGVNNVGSGVTVTDTNFHHIAVTKSGTNVVFYVDGVAHTAGAYNPGFTFSSQAFIGGLGNNYTFLGTIDEVSFYNRALSGTEVQSIYNADRGGKCNTPVAPGILTQPANQTTIVGGNATFSVLAAGTQPLTYQWTFSGTNIDGATGSSVTITNAQFTNAGLYAVLITNTGGSILSSNASLTVNPPPSVLRVADTPAASGATVSVPVLLTANGFENALQFSLSFNTSRLAYVSTTLTLTNGATLLLNESGTSTGRVGLLIGLPSGTTFDPGTQQLAQVTFTTAIFTNATTTPVNFADLPIVRQVSDKSGSALTANYLNGTVSIASVVFEADLAPRPTGDKAVTVTDWVLVGLFAAHLDVPTNALEFQKADCAPRDTLGDGHISIIDWVQAGRYAAALDPLTPVGGPTEPPAFRLSSTKKSSNSLRPLSTRQVQAMDSSMNQGQTGVVAISLQSEGNENALGFSLNFDPAMLTYTGATLGSSATGAALNINQSQLASGKVGFALALPTGAHFAAGLDEVLRVSFKAATSTSGVVSVAFGDSPISREISDPTAHVLSSDYLVGTITVNQLPLLTILQAGTNVSVTWPNWATNFVLQENGTDISSSTSWSNVTATVGTINGQLGVNLPNSGSTRFYRLLKQ